MRISVDWRMLAFAVAASVVVGLACGLAVVFSMDRVSPQGAGLRPSGVDASHHGRRFRHGLIVAEIALALMLVVAAGLLVRTLRVLGGQELGFNPRNVIGVGFSSTGTSTTTGAAPWASSKPNCSNASSPRPESSRPVSVHAPSVAAE